MNTAKLINILKMGNLTIPIFLVKNYQKLNIDIQGVILLSYLMNKEPLFDYKLINNDLGLKETEILQGVNKLQESGVLSFSVTKNDKGIMEEFISLEPLYNKLSLILIEDINSGENNKANIYQLFEEEFGRTLSPIEYEIISGWLESNYSDEIIKEALKEAVYNGANNLRYIDKILFEWHKKGIRKLVDLEKERVKHAKTKKETIEVPDYNWLEDDDE